MNKENAHALQQTPKAASQPTIAPAAAGGKGSQLLVEALWHEQVHQSRITCLEVAADGEALVTGCAAAAPRLKEGPDFPAATISTKDGKVLQNFAGCGLQNILRVLRAEPDQLTCLNDQGVVVGLKPASRPAQRVQLAVAEGEDEDEDGDEVAGAPGEEEQAAIDAAGLADAALEQEQPTGSGGPAPGAEAATLSPAPVAASGVGPEFLAETGYRGVREGYLFRSGTKGLGYYRKDVVRLYAPSRPRGTASASAAEQPPASAPAPAAAGDSVAVGSSAEQPQQEERGAAVTAEQALQSAAASSAYVQRLLAAPPSMHSAITTRNGALLITASLGPKDHCLRVWQLAASGTGGTAAGAAAEGGGAAAPPCQPTLLHTLSGHAAPVLSLALNPEGTLLFSGSYDYTIRVWSTTDWSCLRVLKGHGGGVRALAVAPEGSMLYSAAGDNTLRTWSTKLWVCLRTLHGRHEQTTWPCSLALSPDGELLASGSNGLFGASTIKVFQTRSRQGQEAGACLATFAQLGFIEKGAVSALAFSTDGSTLYSGASDGSVAAWRLSWAVPPADGKAGGFRRGFF